MGLAGDVFAGFVIIFGVGLLFSIINQVHTYSLQPFAIDMGVDAGSMDLIDLAYLIFPAGVVIAFMYSIIHKGLQGGGSSGYE